MNNGKLISIVTDQMSPRLTYTLDFIFHEVLEVNYALYSPSDNIIYAEDPIIYYCHDHKGQSGLNIPPMGLLSEQGIEENFDKIEALSEDIIFLLDDPTHEEADIFSFIFYCISRYEEYLIMDFDNLGRFEAKKSLAHKKNFLNRALVDECIHFLVLKIKLRYPAYIFNKKSSFFIQSTIDIDQVWAYAHKGIRNFLGCIRDVATLNFIQLKLRLKAWKNEKKDPFNTFQLIYKLHSKYKTIPKFFVLMASRTSKYDKNHPPEEPNFRKFIKDISKKYHVGIHPSYRSNHLPDILQKEKKALETIISRPVTNSRQHYLILRFPTTYQQLIASNITHDYSMGYAETIGYRASTGHSFYWYDLFNEKRTNLKIIPFQIMDVTLKNYMKMTPEQAILSCNALVAYAKKLGSPICLIWHNNSLDEDGDWRGWVKVYENILHLNH
ncbi:MAG: polysaccharide deacetylase family protein [Saprospiraceae bacterium]|nr:polysaccharide deacetylase family protein [Saprospiraceae bacterium]